MSLFADVPIEDVTVQDVAVEVEMTPAAVYYHFASKEQILYEGTKQFTDQLMETLHASIGSDSTTGPGNVVQSALSWITQAGPSATVYFSSSVGLNQTVEALRRGTKTQMIEELRQLVERIGDDASTAEDSVTALALVSLLETAAASMLNRDGAHRGLGTQRFATEIGMLADKLCGV